MAENRPPCFERQLGCEACYHTCKHSDDCYGEQILTDVDNCVIINNVEDERSSRKPEQN